jgi:ATP-dependent RNA helicase DDX56/DBP9
MLLADVPDVIIATPARILTLIQSKVSHETVTTVKRCSYLSFKNISLESLETLVIDEADLILSYGHDADVRSLLSGNFLPKVYQSLLMSATMSEDVHTLQGLVLRDPVS